MGIFDWFFGNNDPGAWPLNCPECPRCSSKDTYIAILEQQLGDAKRLNDRFMSIIESYPAIFAGIHTSPGEAKELENKPNPKHYKPVNGIESWPRTRQKLEVKHRKHGPTSNDSEDQARADATEAHWRNRNREAEEQLARMGVKINGLPTESTKSRSDQRSDSDSNLETDRENHKGVEKDNEYSTGH